MTAIPQSIQVHLPAESIFLLSWCFCSYNVPNNILGEVRRELFENKTSTRNGSFFALNGFEFPNFRGELVALLVTSVVDYSLGPYVDDSAFETWNM